jgi:lipopolysaccharide transport system permease protein
MTDSAHPTKAVTVIAPGRQGLMSSMRDLIEYRDLFVFWIWRSIKIRYAQSALGIGWAIVQPLFSTIVFTIIFGNLAKINSDGLPYAAFSFAALLPWTFFANSVTESTGSLIQNANMISKIYFPRIILPLGAMVAKLLDFAIAMVVMVFMICWYRIVPGIELLALPILILLMFATSAGVGILLTAMAIQFRDIKYGINFALQLLMYAAPVVYPLSKVPEKYHLVYALNPMVGVIEGFRSCLLNSRPLPWELILIGGVTSTLLLLFSIHYFHTKERLFADVA